MWNAHTDRSDRPPRPRFVPLGLIIVFSSCRPAGPREPPAEPLSGFPVAQAGPDCAPWDGAAVTILFSAPSLLTDSIRPPYLRVSLWKGLEALAGRTWRWPVEEQIGAASLCVTEANCRAAITGVVRLDPVGADSVVTGRLRLDFADRPALGGSFRAAWRARAALCG